MPSGPNATVGDLNGPVDAFPTLLAMIKEEGWTDIGDHSTICNGRPGQSTCHTNEKSKESSIDYIIANQWFTPAVKSCKVDQYSGAPAHTPLTNEIDVADLKQTTKGACETKPCC